MSSKSNTRGTKKFMPKSRQASYHGSVADGDSDRHKSVTPMDKLLKFKESLKPPQLNINEMTLRN